jgi:hypothetical protein
MIGEHVYAGGALPGRVGLAAVNDLGAWIGAMYRGHERFQQLPRAP